MGLRDITLRFVDYLCFKEIGFAVVELLVIFGLIQGIYPVRENSPLDISLDNSLVRTDRTLSVLFGDLNTNNTLLASTAALAIQFNGTPSAPRHPLIPRFLPTATNVTYRESGLAVLYCSVENLGTKTVIWRKQPYNVPITVGEVSFVHLERFYLNHVPHRDEWNLLIKNVQPFDSGTYECQVSSKEKTIRRNITLNVIAKGKTDRPSLIQISGTRFVEKGSQIYLVCNASGTDSPPEGIDWFKDGNMLSHRKRHDLEINKKYVSLATHTVVSELTIAHATMDDTGTYVCRTSELLTTRFKVDVLNAVSINVKRGSSSEHTGKSGCGRRLCSTEDAVIFTLVAMLLVHCIAHFTS